MLARWWGLRPGLALFPPVSLCCRLLNHRMVGVGRDLCGSSSPTLLPKPANSPAHLRPSVLGPPRPAFLAHLPEELSSGLRAFRRGFSALWLEEAGRGGERRDADRDPRQAVPSRLLVGSRAVGPAHCLPCNSSQLQASAGFPTLTCSPFFSLQLRWDL